MEENAEHLKPADRLQGDATVEPKLAIQETKERQGQPVEKGISILENAEEVNPTHGAADAQEQSSNHTNSEHVAQNLVKQTEEEAEPQQNAPEEAQTPHEGHKQQNDGGTEINSVAAIPNFHEVALERYFKSFAQREEKESLFTAFFGWKIHSLRAIEKGNPLGLDELKTPESVPKALQLINHDGYIQQSDWRKMGKALVRTITHLQRTQAIERKRMKTEYVLLEQQAVRLKSKIKQREAELMRKTTSLDLLKARKDGGYDYQGGGSEFYFICTKPFSFTIVC